MASELEKTIKNTINKVAQYVENAATMTVETHYVLVGKEGDTSFEAAKPALRTIIRLDGDNETILPVNENEAGQLELNQEIYDAHQSNVTTAIEYRAKILDSLLVSL